MLIKNFILTNTNKNVVWVINGSTFTSIESISRELLNRYIDIWTVNQLEGKIIITTK